MGQMKEKFPNQLYYMVLVTAEEILGKPGLNAILNYSGMTKFRDNFPPNNMEEEHPSGDQGRPSGIFLKVQVQHLQLPQIAIGGHKVWPVKNLSQ